MDIIGTTKFRIERVSSNEKQKDILSLLYIVWFIILVIIFLNILFSIFIYMERFFFSSIESNENYSILKPNFQGSITNIYLFFFEHLINFII